MTNVNIITNAELNGIEIQCAAKPSQDEIDFFKTMGFRWHREKKIWYAKDSEARRNALTQWLNMGEIPNISNGASKSVKVKQAKKPDYVKSKYDVHVGDIFCTSFGYSMSLVTFYQVLEILSPATVRVGEISYIGADGTTNFMGPSGGYVVPEPDTVRADRVTDKVIKVDRDGQLYLPMDYGKAYKWTGQACYVCTWD